MRYLTALLLIPIILLLDTTTSQPNAQMLDYADIEVQVRGGASPLAGASVVLDLNNNGVWDEHLGEPRGWTDGNGIVGFSDIVSIEDPGDDAPPDASDWQPSRIMTGNLRGTVGARDVQFDFVLPPGAGSASLGLYDLRGRRLAQVRGTGDLSLAVPGGLPAGVFFVRLSAGSLAPVTHRITSVGVRAHTIRARQVAAAEAVAAGWAEIRPPMPEHGKVFQEQPQLIGLLVDHEDYPAAVQQETVEPGFNSFTVYMGPDYQDDVVIAEEVGLTFVNRTEDTITFTFDGEAPDIRVGDVLVGTDDGGYIGRVTSVEVDRGLLTVVLIAILIWELFDSAEVDELFTFDEPPISYPFNNVILFNDILEGEHGSVEATVRITDGHLSYSPSLEFGFRIEDHEFTHYKTILSGQLDFDADVLMSVTGSISHEPEPVSLFSVEKYIWIPKTPLLLIVKFEIEAGCSFNFDSEMTAGVELESQTIGSMGASYVYGDWQPVFTFEPDIDDVGEVASGYEAEVAARVYVRPKVSTSLSALLMASAGPYLSLEPYARLQGEIDPSGWCADLYLGYGCFLGFSGEFLGSSIFDASWPFLSDEFKIFDGCGDDPIPSPGFVYIPPGTFTMGSPDDEPGRLSREGPQHQVTLTQGFYMSQYEVTEEWWHQVMGGSPTNPQLPKRYVSWDLAVQFCNALSLQEGLTPAYTIHGPSGDVTWHQGANGYRLPTEAEWEYACRSGSTTAFANGPLTGSIYCTPVCDNLDAMGWYCGNNVISGLKDVGQKQANEWGLYDMHGNVFEWVWCGSYREYTADAVVDPVYDVGPGASRVVRGGSWADNAQYCRSAFRGDFNPDFEASHGGFRPVRSAN